MKKYTNNTRVGLLIALLSFNALFACVNTKQELGIKTKPYHLVSMLSGLMLTNSSPTNINANQANMLTSNTNNPASTIALYKSPDDYTSTMPNRTTGLLNNMTTTEAASVLKGIYNKPERLARNKRESSGWWNAITNWWNTINADIHSHLEKVALEKSYLKKVYLEKDRSSEARLIEYLSDDKIVKNLMFIGHGFAYTLSQDYFSEEKIQYWLDQGMDRVDPSVGCSLVATLYEYSIPDAARSIYLLIDRGKIDADFNLPHSVIRQTKCPISKK